MIPNAIINAILSRNRSPQASYSDLRNLLSSRHQSKTSALSLGRSQRVYAFLVMTLHNLTIFLSFSASKT
ncbi:hypothetical protein BELL_0265g00090 [Botrytis elliptica]|uniref:Uncharacterized protein n=1 Tax=Botrytis elliptica TaxID=278938 RepID=A0A4Z1JTV7_9HELO|nr:hypothetical protein BELL_0265g00090 [Botrytis elliptica]